MPELLLPALIVLLLVITIILLIKVSRLGGQSLEPRLASLERMLERNERTLREELARGREEAQTLGRQGREESIGAVQTLGDGLLKRMSELAGLQKGQLDIFADQLKNLTDTNDSRMEKLRETLQNRLQAIQEDNAKQLEQMRVTVDEKLHDTLEKRLGESFKLVSDRLEQVQKGLGEMQTLANGVGDLKRVLTNVKTRGTFGEVQLGALLEQVLAPGQYAANVETRKGSGQRVEFALRLPGRDGTEGSIVHLPLDAKFPQEDYLRLVEAQERADVVAAEEAGKLLERAIRLAATDIRDKYLDPPQTTDFGIMFLPTEGLYAEVLRRPALADALQRDLKVLVAGPTTLAALLNSLQMGFRTLAIEKRSAEVWNLLGAVRTEFGKFGEMLDKTSKKLQEAGNHIEAAATRTRQMERKLKNVQALPSSEAQSLLGVDAVLDES
ncbi:DNA recombination protein RmuC [Trichlorobacter thiogenes]|uniref:DNA recombination protein RmuC n=1 Tax=Trichlorobacter thiogenes TaxID=115783 RepID=A0A1T4R7F9_9BACT|nr:DNA recombination protein RmuC [Trichlorobacter thiogenes]SKA12010.1 DNA recombination protein RmuC [Trichlorobacter thiogenes]